MKQSGYLLIEMLIALAMVTAISLMVAHLQSCLVCWHKEAEQYLMATTMAQKTLAYMQTGNSSPASKDGFTVKIDSERINSQIPFMLDTVTVSFITPRGITKEITMVGGRLHAMA